MLPGLRLMALWTAEPGQSVEPHRHRLAVGINLGTTSCRSPRYATAFPPCWTTPRAGRCCPRPVRPPSSSAPRKSATPRAPVGRPAQHRGFGQALHGPRAPPRCAEDIGNMPFEFARRARHVAVVRTAGTQGHEPGGGVVEHPAALLHARAAAVPSAATSSAR